VEAYLLHGRVPKKVFAKHCLKGNIEEFKSKYNIELREA
jgi:hypothetical protein